MLFLMLVVEEVGEGGGNVATRASVAESAMSVASGSKLLPVQRVSGMSSSKTKETVVEVVMHDKPGRS